LTEKKLLLSILLVFTVLGFTISNLGHVRFAGSSSDGLKFCKLFRGNVESILGNVTIKDANTGEIYWKGELPADGKICIYVLHNTEVVILWRDWRGQQQERHLVECNGNYDELVNEIPFPKSE